MAACVACALLIESGGLRHRGRVTTTRRAGACYALLLPRIRWHAPRGEGRGILRCYIGQVACASCHVWVRCSEERSASLFGRYLSHVCVSVYLGGAAAGVTAEASPNSSSVSHRWLTPAAQFCCSVVVARLLCATAKQSENG